MIDMKRTGQKIKDTCSKQGVTVSKIQKELHIGAFQSIYNWFSGKTLPNLDNFYSLSKLLNIPMEKLIVEENEKQEMDGYIDIFIANSDLILCNHADQNKNQSEHVKRIYQYGEYMKNTVA